VLSLLSNEEYITSCFEGSEYTGTSL